MGLMSPIGPIGPIRLIGLMGPIGFMGLIRLMSPISPMGRFVYRSPRGSFNLWVLLSWCGGGPRQELEQHKRSAEALLLFT